MALAEKDFRRVAEAVVAEHGDGAASSVRRYIEMLRQENRHDLAEDWRRVMAWIEVLGSRSIH